MQKLFLTPTALEIMEGGNMPVWKNGDKYVVAVEKGRYKDGRKKYQRETVDSKGQAKQREKEILKELKQLNEHLSTPQIKDEPFSDVAKKWLKDKKFEVTFRTWERYNTIVLNYLIPAFSDMGIGDIDEDDVKDYFYTSKNSGTTLRQHYTILKGIFDSEGIKIMDGMKRPQKNNTEINCIKDPFELKEFVYSFVGSILFLPVYIAAMTGMRLSEIAGLKWSDVDFKNARISVNRSLHWKKENNKREWYTKSTKNGSSRRNIKISQKDVEVLKEEKEKRKASNKDFVCLDGNGNPVNMRSLSPAFCRRARAKKRGEKDISFHSLRHSHATILIQYYRKSINAVSRRLGHSSEVTTLKIYASVLPQEDEDIANTMGDIMSEDKQYKSTHKYTLKSPIFSFRIGTKKTREH